LITKRWLTQNLEKTVTELKIRLWTILLGTKMKIGRRRNRSRLLKKAARPRGHSQKQMTIYRL